jgi:hypothetical protein
MREVGWGMVSGDTMRRCVCENTLSVASHKQGVSVTKCTICHVAWFCSW